MRDVLTKILDGYLFEKQKSFSENPLANYIREKAVDRIKEDLLIDEKIYKVAASPGIGNWAEIPWIAVFDREITETAQEGYYIVYLFRKDMSGVYLSLNMGWTFFEKNYGIKEGRNKIKEATEKFRKILSDSNIEGINDFDMSKIDLKSENTLATGYELGHILGKFYSKVNIPGDDILINDLEKLIRVYEVLKTVAGVGKFENILSRINNIQPELVNIVGQILSDKEIGYTEDDEGFPEGKKALKQHLARERNRKLVKLAKEKFLSKHGKLFCEICGFDFSVKYGEIGKNYIEAHYTIPVSEMEEGSETKVEDIVLVCSNCHRMLHRRRPWLLKDELRKLIEREDWNEQTWNTNDRRIVASGWWYACRRISSSKKNTYQQPEAYWCCNYLKWRKPKSKKRRKNKSWRERHYLHPSKSRKAWKLENLNPNQ